MWTNQVGQGSPGAGCVQQKTLSSSSRMTVPGEGPVGHALAHCHEAIDSAGSLVRASGGPFGPMDFHFYQ
jgi:hypothetical protein